jgi:integrase
MPRKWITIAPGIRTREHDSRRHGVRLDRYFTLRFSADGRQVEEALGWASEGWTLARAQEELGKLREAQRTGEGPTSLRERAASNRRTERQRIENEAAQARQQKTMADLWDRYAKEVIAVSNKPRTAADKMWMWKRRIEPAIGNMRVADVTAEEVGAIIRGALRLDARGQVVSGKAPAGQVYRLLHHMFAKALVWGLRPQALGNPLSGVAEPRVARRERLLTQAEVGALLRALDAAAADMTEEPQIVAIIRAAILTGARIGELLTLQWEHVLRDDMLLHLPDTKTGFSRRPLSAETLALFDSLYRVVGSPFVFRALKDPKRALPYNTVEKAFRRIISAAGVTNCTLHTVRHWFATATANSVANPRVGMLLTGHKSHAAYMHYLHGDQEQARALADQLAALAKSLGAAAPNVVALPKVTNS